MGSKLTHLFHAGILHFIDNRNFCQIKIPGLLNNSHNISTPHLLCSTDSFTQPESTAFTRLISLRGFRVTSIASTDLNWGSPQFSDHLGSPITLISDLGPLALPQCPKIRQGVSTHRFQLTRTLWLCAMFCSTADGQPATGTNTCTYFADTDFITLESSV